jgi:DNA-binding NarL/FixJ family response regulator
MAAIAIARRLGAEPLRREVEALARRARVDLDAVLSGADGPPAAARRVSSAPTSPGVGGPILSARELEVLRLVADGRSNGQIAERLFISRKTASVHVSHILDKLGVGNRVEAAMVGARLGLLEPVEADQVSAAESRRRRVKSV